MGKVGRRVGGGSGGFEGKHKTEMWSLELPLRSQFRGIVYFQNDNICKKGEGVGVCFL